MTNAVEILLCDSRGIYIPQDYANLVHPAGWSGVSDDDLEVLRAGPDHEWYWEAWESVLQDAVHVDGWTLYQDGDLFAVHPSAEWSDKEDWFVVSE